jgi:hypothetical protein
MKRLKSKKSGLNIFYPQPEIGTFENRGDPIIMIHGHSQDLDFKYISSAFPEKVECTFVLAPLAIEKEVNLMIDFGDGQKIEKSDIYGKKKAYALLDWGNPTDTKVVRQNILYPMDKKLSVHMESRTKEFHTLEEAHSDLEHTQEYSYGGFLPEHSSLDQLYQLNVIWSEDQEEAQDSSRGPSMGDWVRDRGLKIYIIDKNIQYIQSYNDSSSVLQNANVNSLDDNAGVGPVKQNYASYDYSMIDADKMLVTFFPTES